MQAYQFLDENGTKFLRHFFISSEHSVCCKALSTIAFMREWKMKALSAFSPQQQLPPRSTYTKQIWRKHKKCVRAIKKIYYTFAILCFKWIHFKWTKWKAENAHSMGEQRETEGKKSALIFVWKMYKMYREMMKKKNDTNEKQAKQRECEKWWWESTKALKRLFLNSFTPSLILLLHSTLVCSFLISFCFGTNSLHCTIAHSV